MKFVPTKSADQLDPQALHRVRERLVRQRIGTINQIRAFLLSSCSTSIASRAPSPAFVYSSICRSPVELPNAA
jgi:hypothetical protein